MVPTLRARCLHLVLNLISNGMKKINLLLIAMFCAGALLSSCSLEETPYEVDESYVTGADVSEALLLGIYQKLGTDGIYRQNLPFIFNLPTDESKTSGENLTAQRTEGSNAFTSSSPYVQDTWKALYSAIYDANYFIDLMERKMPNFSQKDQEQCAYFVAEAKALRGLLYFELVRWFGNVPIVLSPSESYRKPEEFVQASPEKVYEQIEQDLTDALGVLPYVTEDTVRKKTAFRISRGGVLGLLTKVYATWAGYPVKDETKWQKAVNTAEELINEGPHGLLSDFEQLWKNSGSNKWDPKESLLELSYWSPLSTFESCGRVGVVNGVRATKGGFRNGDHTHAVFYNFHPTFLTSWEGWENDRRFSLTYADYMYKPEGKVNVTTKKVDGVSDTGVTFIMAWQWKDQHKDWRENWRFEYCYLLTNQKWDTEKYVPDENYQVNGNYSNVNWYLLRYADVLLLYAEALNELNDGPTAAAYNAINMVRRRGYGLDIDAESDLADLTPGLTYEQFRDAVRNERAWELASEGHRRQDLVRWGIYYEKVMETYVSLKDWYVNAQRYFIGGEYTVKGRHELLPIPQREIDLCGYKQNPGWI